MQKKYIWIWVVVAVIALIAGLLTYLSRDIPPFDDSDMAVSPIILKDEENAYFDLLEIEKTIYYPEEKKELITKMANGEEWDQALADELIAKNEKALKSFRNMLTRKGYQDPEVQKDPSTFGPETQIHSVVFLRAIAQINGVLAEKQFRNNEYTLARKTALDVAQFGQLLQDSPRQTMVHHLVGMVVEKIGLGRLIQFSSKGQSATESIFIISSLEALNREEYGLAEVFKGEYTTVKNLLSNQTNREELINIAYDNLFKDWKNPQGNKLQQFLLKGEGSSHFYYKRNKTQKMVYDKWKDVVGRSYCSVKVTFDDSEFVYENKMRFGIYFTENILGEALIDELSWGLDGTFKKKCQESFLVLQTQLSLAVNAYKAEHGAYPKSLDELAPKYMELVPKEFAGRPLEYDAVTGRIAEMKDFYSSE